MKPVTLDPQADEELLLAAAWYEEQREGLAQAFLRQTQRTMNRISENPHWFPKADTPSATVVRRAPVFRFPYSVLYCERSDDILILAISHAKRRPGYWFNRIH